MIQRTVTPFLMGIDIQVSRHLNPDIRRQVRFPRSKRKRIRKKWRRDQRNWAWVQGDGPECIRYEVPPLGQLTPLPTSIGLMVIPPPPPARPAVRWVCTPRFYATLMESTPDIAREVQTEIAERLSVERMNWLIGGMP